MGDYKFILTQKYLCYTYIVHTALYVKVWIVWLTPNCQMVLYGH